MGPPARKQQASSDWGASQQTARSSDCTDTFLHLDDSARPGTTESETLSQSTVCGPLPLQFQGQPPQFPPQSARQKRAWEDTSNLEPRSSKRLMIYRSTFDRVSCDSDECDGEEEVQSRFKHAANASGAPIQQCASTPTPIQRLQIQPSQSKPRLRPQPTAQLNFPVLRRASAGCKPQVGPAVPCESLCLQSMGTVFNGLLPCTTAGITAYGSCKVDGTLSIMLMVHRQHSHRSLQSHQGSAERALATFSISTTTSCHVICQAIDPQKNRHALSCFEKLFSAFSLQ